MSKIDLCWIDDSAQEMSLIMEHVFPSIWSKNYSCKTILFGNDYCYMESENGPNENDRTEFEEELNNLFIFFCQMMDEEEWKDIGDTYNAKKYLLPSPSVSLVSMNASDSIKQLASNWMDSEKLKKFKDYSDMKETDAQEEDSTDINDMSVSKLIEAMGIPEGAVVALDICLLYHDISRIEEGLPSISMALYDKLLKQHHKCYLYSGRTDSRAVLDCWEKTYHELYGDKGDVKIHPKKGLTTKQNVTEAKKNLIDMLSKEEQGEPK